MAELTLEMAEKAVKRRRRSAGASNPMTATVVDMRVAWFLSARGDGTGFSLLKLPAKAVAAAAFKRRPRTWRN